MMATKRTWAISLLAAVCVGCAQPPVSQTPPGDGTPTPGASEGWPGPSFSQPGPSETPVAPSSPTPSPTVSSPLPTGDVAVTIIRATPTAGRLQVAAMVTGLVEDDGTCQLAASDGNTVLSATSQALADAQTTVCDPLVASPVGPGVWYITVTYSSTRHYGVSPTIRIEVTA